MIATRFKAPFLAKLPFANKLALIAATLSLSCCLLLIALSQQNLHSIHSKLLNQLGTELSQQLAINARPALIQGDNLSLQSLLMELVNSESVTKAVIYNVENKPLAEAGQRLPGKAFTATINYQDSIAGYSLLILTPEPLKTLTTGLFLQQLLLSFLLSACCYAFILWGAGKLGGIFKQLEALIKAPNYPINARRKKIRYWGDDDLQRLIGQTLKGPDPIAKTSDQCELAMIHIQLDAKHGIDPEQAAELLNKYHQQLKIIGKLYEGQLDITRPNSFTATFYQNKHHNDHPFKALCSGKIIEQLFFNADGPFSIRLAAGLATRSDDFAKQQTIENCIQLINSSDTTLNISRDILAHPSVSDRIDDDSKKDNDRESIELNAPYHELIDRQFAALQLQFQRSEHSKP